MPRVPLTAVEREAWGLLGRELHTIGPREWWEIQSKLREAFEQPAPRTAEAFPLEHLEADPFSGA